MFLKSRQITAFGYRRSFLPFQRCAVRRISTTSKHVNHTIRSSAQRTEVAFGGRKVSVFLGTASVAAVGLLYAGRHEDNHGDDPRDVAMLSTVSLSKLCSGWIAFAFCAWPTWVDKSESLYAFVSAIPIISSIANAFVVRTFFNQFLGGQSLEECLPKIEALREHQIGTLLGYNNEAETDGSNKDAQLILSRTRHILSSIEAQGKLAKRFCPSDSATGGDSRCWVKIKATGLLTDPSALCRGSIAILEARQDSGLDKDVPYPGLPHDGDWEAALKGSNVTDADRAQLLGLRVTLESIASKARDNNVRIIIDAEQTWYQPVIDSLTEELMQKYNTSDGPATCVASFQAYLRRYPRFLDYQIHRAEEKGYKLLFKQVRGAYMITEAQKWEEGGRKEGGPVWMTKAETDASYNTGMEKTLAIIADQISKTGESKISAVFATHNSMSVDLGIKLLEKYGLANRDTSDGRLLVAKEAAGSIAFAQIYGMRDDLTNRISGSLNADGEFPLVVKSMSYGDLKEAMPYLSRRAIENKSILEGRGGAVFERIRLGREIRRRILPFAS